MSASFVKRAIRVVCSLTAAAAAMLAAIATAEACSCGCNPDAAASLRALPVLFRGRLIAVGTAGHDRVFQFVVSKTYRGTVPARVGVRTNFSSAACGAQFEANAEVLVGAYQRGGGLRTTLCIQYCMQPRMAEIERLLAACKPGGPCPPEP